MNPNVVFYEIGVQIVGIQVRIGFLNPELKSCHLVRSEQNNIMEIKDHYPNTIPILSSNRWRKKTTHHPTHQLSLLLL